MKFGCYDKGNTKLECMAKKHLLSLIMFIFQVNYYFFFCEGDVSRLLPCGRLDTLT